MSTNEDNISIRLKTVIELVFNEKGRVKELERLTGISASSWKNFLNGQQKATIFMVEKISQIQPTQAFWIATGISDCNYGHTSPDWLLKNGLGQLKSGASAQFFAEEIKATTDESIKVLRKGLKVLSELNLIEKKQISPSFNANFYEKLRWIEIFLDEYLLSVPIDACIDTFNELRSQADLLEKLAVDEQQKTMINNLTSKFFEKKDEIEKSMKQINHAQNKK
jgi:hypothetical protein